MDVLEWVTTEEGIRIVEPGGKSMTSPKSQRIIWPPVRKSKAPRAVMEHHPNARLPGSVWGNVIVHGPKLTVAAGHGLLAKFRGAVGLASKSLPSSIT